MLARVIESIGMSFLLAVFFMSGVIFMGMAGKWYAVQDQAQFIASSQGKFGGYTTEADAVMYRFCQDYNLEVTVAVSAPNNPVPWGTPVWARITVPYRFGLGSVITPFTVPITGVGRSVSSYLPGTMNVTYTSP